MNKDLRVVWKWNPKGIILKNSDGWETMVEYQCPGCADVERRTAIFKWRSGNGIAACFCGEKVRLMSNARR